ncbi:MAG: tape measure protein, partial [Ignavibacteria bacterium]
MADEYTSIQNRMKLYITDAQELTKVNAKLAQFSIANNVGLRETTTLFTRLAPSMQKIGANTAAVTSVVDAFGKSLRIGGATAMEAASATIQFSQAMASGKLAGDEFRSISEASPRFLKAIAEGSGIAAEKLKEMSAAGALTTEVISKALLKEYPKLIEENKKLGITLEQGANALKTGFLVAFGEFNEGAGITKSLGESMTNLAQSMLTAAQGARQFGADINKWFKDNANTINTVIEGFKVLASVVAAKYIVSVVAAIGSTAILTWNFVSLSAAIAGMSRTAFLGATALTALGNAAKGVALSTGGIVGLLTTVASAALIYTAFRDNAAEANAKLVEQSDIVRMTKEEVEALTNAQKENLKVKTIIDMKDANKNIDEAEAKYLSMMDVLTGKSFGNTLPSSAEKLISQAADGTKAFDDVTVSLLNMGVISEKTAKKLFDQTGVIVTAKQEALKYGNNARLLGIDLEITGNKAHNATPAITGFKSEVQGVGDEADIAGGKVRKFYQDLQTDTKKNILAFDLTNKL